MQDAIYFDVPRQATPRPAPAPVMLELQVTNTKLLEAVERVPDNGRWYEIMLSFSKGHASRSSSDINHGHYGERIQAAYDRDANDAYPDAHRVFIRKGRRLT